MADSRTCETCGLAVPADSDICPRDGTVMLDFSMPRAAAPADSRQTAPGKTMMMMEDLSDSLVGLKLGEYELRQRIGVGGMGLVYDGIQPLIGKRVAVKVLRPELAAAEEQVARLLAEARAVNAIRHRGIVDIFGFGQVPDGRQYIIMEYLEGVALDAHLAEKGRLPVNEVLDILDEVLSALGAAHGAGVVHRDLKPSNFFLVQQPDGSRYVKLLDFGLAKVGMPAGRTAQTRTDMVVGTPEYMAPEQARGQPVGPMTDLYALGVVAFEMITGRLPFTGSSPVDLLLKHVDARPPRPSEYLPGLPAALDAFILQMLTKDPEARPGSAEQLRRQLQRLRESLQAPAPVPAATASPAAAPPAPAEPPPPPAPVPAEPPQAARPVTPPAPTPSLPSELPMVEPLATPVASRRWLPLGLGAVGVLVVGTGLTVALLRDPPPVTPPPAAPPVPEVATQPRAQPQPQPSPTPAVPSAPTTAVAQQDPPSTAGAPNTGKPELAVVPLEPPAETVPALAHTATPSARPVVQRIPSAPTPSALSNHLSRLQQNVDDSIRSGRKLSPASQSILARIRSDVDGAKTPEARRKVAEAMEKFEKVVLGKR